MATAYDRAIARYRRWYARLLRFYPKPYRERFGESMEQTFTDLCREQRGAEGGLLGFALWMFAETSAGIMREHITSIRMNNAKPLIRPLLVTLGILLIPFLGNLYVDGWNWNWTSFVFLGVVLFGAGLAYEFAGKYARAGVIGGFVVGGIVAAGVIATLRYMNPEEDVAGIVILTFLLSGLLFASIGYLIQRYLKRK